MTLIRCLSLLIFLTSSSILATQIGLAANPVATKIQIKVAAMMVGRDPVLSDVACVAGSDCRIFKEEESEIDLSINIHPENGLDELKVKCSKSCSFESGRTTVQFSSGRHFYLFKGATGISIPLVLKESEKIGEILLIYPGPDDKWRAEGDRLRDITPPPKPAQP